jgi:cell division protein ZapE
MKDIQIVLENLSSQGINIDKHQEQFISEFLSEDDLFKKPSFFSKGRGLGNIYLWGPVGRGKTMLLNAILESYFQDFGKFHFLELMQMIHKKLSNLTGQKDPLIKVTQSIAEEHSVIFIDEFQVEDIADAMIVGNIFKALIGHGTRIMLSSNAEPSELYKEGLQRAKFLQTIELITSHFKVFNLIGSEDYRLKEIASFDDDIIAVNTNQKIRSFLQSTFDIELSSKSSFEINDRSFPCLESFSDKFLWLSFKDFFSRPCSSLDFIKMVKKFDWIFINDFHHCSDDDIDKIRRFISFIDIAYQEKQKMKFFYTHGMESNLYSGVLLQKFWERSASRLHEISTKKYLKNLKKN